MDKSISFEEKNYEPEYNVTELFFNLEQEIWNSSPFRIIVLSGSSALGLSCYFNQSGNATHVILYYSIGEPGVLIISFH